jgi:hypothetical protein
MTGQATRELSESDLQRRVMDLAKLRGWMVCHFRAAKTQRGRWVTPIAGHAGAPDLLLARGGVVLLAELKSRTGQLRPGQGEWLAALGEHGRLWRPASWSEIEETLK